MLIFPEHLAEIHQTAVCCWEHWYQSLELNYMHLYIKCGFTFTEQKSGHLSMIFFLMLTGQIPLNLHALISLKDPWIMPAIGKSITTVLRSLTNLFLLAKNNHFMFTLFSVSLVLTEMAKSATLDRLCNLLCWLIDLVSSSSSSRFLFLFLFLFFFIIRKSFSNTSQGIWSWYCLGKNWEKQWDPWAILNRETGRPCQVGKMHRK